MKKLIITAIVIAGIAATFTCISSGKDTVDIDEVKCWSVIRSGDTVRGIASLHFYEGGRAFLTNPSCRSNILFIGGSSSPNLLDTLRHKLRTHPRAIGIRVRVYVEGVTYRNKYMDDLFINATMKVISKTKSSDYVTI